MWCGKVRRCDSRCRGTPSLPASYTRTSDAHAHLAATHTFCTADRKQRCTRVAHRESLDYPLAPSVSLARPERACAWAQTRIPFVAPATRFRRTSHVAERHGPLAAHRLREAVEGARVERLPALRCVWGGGGGGAAALRLFEPHPAPDGQRSVTKGATLGSGQSPKVPHWAAVSHRMGSSQSPDGQRSVTKGATLGSGQSPDARSVPNVETRISPTDTLRLE
eukprot:gene21948-biopygen5707